MVMRISKLGLVAIARLGSDSMVMRKDSQLVVQHPASLANVAMYVYKYYQAGTTVKTLGMKKLHGIIAYGVRWSGLQSSKTMTDCAITCKYRPEKC